MKIENVPVDKIQQSFRYREDFGDVEALAQSMREIGLLQPIGVDKYYSLVWGARRLYAAISILKWPSIPCHIVDIESALIGEYSENEFRKEFTPSERVAIAKAVERELGKRQGRRTDQLQEDLPEVKGKQSRQVAAKRAGFGNERTYRKAATVVELGVPELVAAMDKQSVSIDAAEVITKSVPREKQAEVVAMPKEQRRQVVRDAREKQKIKEQQRETEVVGTFIQWVKNVGNFSMEPKEFWEAVGRRYKPEFYEQFERAIVVLLRLKEEHPNASNRPRAVRK